MKFIVSESQYELLSESFEMGRLKRMVNKESFEKYILETQDDFPLHCDDFVDKSEYSDIIIGMAIDHFFVVNEDYFTENSYGEFIDRIFPVCQKWYGDDLTEYYLTTCGNDMMNEAVDIAMDSRIIVKLFKFLNIQKKLTKTKKDLLKVIEEYAPHFNIPKGMEAYILELYLLNFVKSGDYSSLSKDNFVDPRDMSGKMTSNEQSSLYTKALLPFKGSNLEGYWRNTGSGKIYIVKSYGWYPVYIYKDNKWYETSDRYSPSTGRHMRGSSPYGYDSYLESNVYLLSKLEMSALERGATHEEVINRKKQSFKDVAPSLVSQKLSTIKSNSYGDTPNTSIKFKISSVDEVDDKSVVTVDVQDVLKTRDGKQIATPENYLKGEIPNVTPERVEKQIENKLRYNLQDYLGPKYGDKPEEENIVFRFNHLKK